MQECVDFSCGGDGTSEYILNKHLKEKEAGKTTYWAGLSSAEQNALANDDWNPDVWKDAVGGPGVTKADALHDPVVWLLSLYSAGRLASVAGGLESTGATFAYCQTTQCDDELTSLYRAVGSGELDDIMKSGMFRPDPRGLSMDTKWFWEQLPSAQGFVQKYSNLSHIVSVTIPKSVIDLGYRATNLDNFGPAVAFIDESLDALNRSIISIQEILSR